MSNQVIFQAGCGVAALTALLFSSAYAFQVVRQAIAPLSKVTWRIRFAREAIAYAVAILFAGVR